MGNESNDAAAIIEYAKAFTDAQLVEIEGGELLVTPAGRSVQSLKKFIDEYRTEPERKKGTASITALESFIAHVNRTKAANSVLFANESREKPALLAVYDYNESGDKGAPRFGEHRASYSFPVSDEWRAWAAASGKPMDQATFAAFLEDRIVDVMDPASGGDSIKEFAVNLGIDLATPQRLMTLSRGLEVNVGQRVVNATTLGTGEAQIVFTEEHKDTGGAPLRVPGGFAIAIPVFRLGDLYQVPVRLRYRVDGGKIGWALSLHRTDAIFMDAFKEAAGRAAKETELPLFYGTPET